MPEIVETPDVVLIGAGIMSATLAVMLRALEPDWTIQVFERLDQVAAESSDAWNNAGTGHSAFCELNYTPEQPDGAIDVSKALKIAAQFETSKDFWATLVERGILADPAEFIVKVPHMSFVRADNLGYLRRRWELLSEHHLFRGMEYAEDWGRLTEWVPLMMDGRDRSEKIAATRMEIGTDVNFGALTRAMLASSGCDVFCTHEIGDIDPGRDKLWHISVTDMQTRQRRWIRTPFVFIGAGGGTLRLLERSDIPEARGYGGFPVSGQWLICQNDQIVQRHGAKVYGKAAVGAPPMSVPHLDTRVIGGKKALLFGPYAGFSTRFLKKGSLLDLPGSLHAENLAPMISAGLRNIPLTRYLLDQLAQSDQDRLHTLRDFVPTAELEDWRLDLAGQRVQVIKKDKTGGGILEFGTELVVGGGGTIAGLLGASPGASTAVSIMLELIERCFAEKIQSERWRAALKELIPSYGESLAKNEELALKTRERSTRLLAL